MLTPHHISHVTLKQELIADHEGSRHLAYIYGGKEEMKHVENTKHLGEIIYLNDSTHDIVEVASPFVNIWDFKGD